MPRSTWAVAACIACALICGTRASAQEDREGVRGTVRDAMGVIPAAAVVLVNEDTRVERLAVTSEIGEYVFSAIVPGTYTVRVSLPGFATEERKGLRLGAPPIAALDFMLDAGTLSTHTVLTSSSCRNLFFGAISPPATRIASVIP